MLEDLDRSDFSIVPFHFANLFDLYLQDLIISQARILLMSSKPPQSQPWTPVIHNTCRREIISSNSLSLLLSPFSSFLPRRNREPVPLWTRLELCDSIHKYRILEPAASRFASPCSSSLLVRFKCQVA